MDYQSTMIGFAADIVSKAKNQGENPTPKPGIGFMAEFVKGCGDPNQESSIGFNAKLRAPAKPQQHPQISFDF